MTDTRLIDMPATAQTAPPGGPALELGDLRKTYPATRHSPARRALDGLSLTVHAGEWVSLLGPNGSGKSTLVRILSGADLPDSGTVRIFGAERFSRTGRLAAARLGVVFQRPGLDPLLSVRENLEAQASLFGLRGRERTDRIQRVTEQLGLTDRLADRVSALSGGLQRRTDLARALLHSPDLLILDEATSGLDHQARTAFLDVIERLRAADPRGVFTILMTTHLMDEAERSGRVVMMAAGRIAADAPPEQLRSAAGGRRIRATPTLSAPPQRIERALRDAGLAASVAENGVTMGSSQGPDSPAAIEQAAAALVRLGVPFEVSHPNLGDIYLSLTGSGLEAAPAQEPSARRRRAR